MRGVIAYPGDGVLTQHRSPPQAAPQAFSIPECRRLPSAGPLPIPRHAPGPSPMSLIRRRRPSSMGWSGSADHCAPPAWA
jgi:hypothetical protein